MSNYEKLVDMFIDSEEIGHYNPDNNSIMLYDILNTSKTLRDLINRIDGITQKYKLVILYPERETTNINILDIDL